MYSLVWTFGFGYVVIFIIRVKWLFILFYNNDIGLLIMMLVINNHCCCICIIDFYCFFLEQDKVRQENCMDDTDDDNTLE